MPGFKPKSLSIVQAPEELAKHQKSSEIEGAPRPPKMTSMFGSVPAPVYLAPKKPKAKPAVTLNASNVPKAPTPLNAPKAPKAEDPDSDSKFDDIESEDLKEMKDLIENEKSGLNPDGEDKFYEPKPSSYVHTTSRGFSDFIKQTYSSFMLDPSTTSPPNQEKYPYQRFIREYMRNESPYRGILTYHGLGSGKTCTAIATAEALYSRGRKKIIVMTPFSLRKNFLKEVSLCGFRHFRLNNFWTSMPVSNADAKLFATSVLGIPELHLRSATSIWIPDFRQAESNYKMLSADQQTEIRNQILSILIWDPKKNPTGLIRFINYNGISAKKLKEIACKDGGADYFNDAVIVIDEIHNVVRLIQGTIDPYLLSLPGAKRIIEKETVTLEPWKPLLCAKPDKNYMRGYLFYRLLLDAKNSKIVGLSGTPIINFPEEVGILMNILHGYIPTLEFLIQEIGEKSQTAIKELFMKNIYIDFVSVINDSTGRGSKVTLTLLPYGIRKNADGVGVERMPSDAPIPSIDKVIEELKKSLVDAKFTLSGEISTRALPLLPPFGEEFRKNFIRGDEINNKLVLVKRLTGLISYYKGSRADLMPRVKLDTVIRVPTSVFSQKGYVTARNEEISKEKKKKSGAGEVGGAWAEVFDVGTGAQTSNYKMASRQACNFVFPSDVIRPKPKNKKEARKEADSGNKLADIIDTVIETNKDTDFPELDDDDEDTGTVNDEDEQLREELEAGPPALEGEALAKEQDPDAYRAVGGNPVKPTMKEPAPESAPKPVVPEPAPKPLFAEPAPKPLFAEPAPKPTVASVVEEPPKRKFGFKPKALEAKASELEEAMKAKALAQRSECKSGVNEPYDKATERAKECLQTIGKYSLKLGGENGLETHSPKYAKMLELIAASPGSNLVYSQFLDMEGIGIFRITMNVNGYAPIEITMGPSGPVFTKDTLASLAKGPGGQSRYMTFSGGEVEDIRRLYLDIFNANFNDLPETLKSVLQTNKFVNNHKGEIAKVFCITSAGAEGLSLKCVRGVHIMEPYWNDVRLKQVKGRAIRIGSHLELPEKDRDVSIYTYLTCFSEEAQIAKAGDKRIDETIRQSDGVDRESAVILKLPIPEGAMQYVLTTDEKIYEIAQRKKTITNALENVMKSAAVDCSLNFKENKDGTFQCITIEKSVGDFMYHPDIDIDIRESASKFAVQPVAERPLKPVQAEKPKDYILKELKGTIYRMKAISSGDLVTGFEMYENIDNGKLLGKSSAKGGKPSAPITWFKE